MTHYSLRDLSKGLANKLFSSVEITSQYLSNIQNSSHNAFISIDPDETLKLAHKADAYRHNHKNPHPLAGVPIAHKDIFCTKNFITTCGSKMLENYRSPFNATIVEKLNQAHMVTLGKTNMDEFAMGSSNENPHFGAVKNPWNEAKVAGGSSGGTAAAIAANLAPIGTGSDTGGSVRQPAAFCGITGFKPTYGRISRYGMIAYASSLDQAGIMGQSADDISMLFDVIQGFDAKDSTSHHQIYESILPLSAEKSFKIGLPDCYFDANLQPAIKNSIENAIKSFESLGATIIPLKFSLSHLWIPCYYVIACAEASSNLARFDGLRYGHHAKGNFDLQDLIKTSRSEGFGLEVKRRILTGTHVLSHGYFDAYYLQALKIRRLIQAEFLEAFKTVDIILGPTTPTTAFDIGEHQDNPVLNYLADIYTVPVNLAGFPALSLPAGAHENLPIGMQLIAAPFKDKLLLSIAHQFQSITDWHLKRPGVSI